MTEARFQRETAIRVFAKEYRDSRVHLPGEGEKDPSYVVTPTGARVNRLHVVGVCTEVEPVGESGELWRARISDPTGVFTVYAGQYQPEAAEVLSELQPPAFLSVTGKARTYEPEPGSFFVSIRPESVHEVDEATRDQWIIDTARRTKERIEGDQSSATEHYPDGDVGQYRSVVVDALQGLLPGGEVMVHEISSSDDGGFEGTGGSDAPAWTPPETVSKEADPEQDALDDRIVAIVSELEGDDGASWDDILDAAKDDKTQPEDIEESLNRLMDKGLVYEPVLGVLKTT